MQIHQLNPFAGPLGPGVFLALDNGNDTGKIAFSDLFKQNSFTTLWQGAVNAINSTIELNDGISNYDFIDVYYGFIDINNLYQIEYKHIPVTYLSDPVRIDMVKDLGNSASFRNIWHYVTQLTKTADDELTISQIDAWTWDGGGGDSATTTNTSDLYIYRVDGIKTPGNNEGLVLTDTITVDKDDWNGTTQTVTVDNITANSSVLVCPIPSDQTSALGFGVYCSGQGVNELTFTCVTTPTVDIQYNIMVVG